MIDHFGINCVDYPKSQQFYDRVLGVLGYSRQADVGDAIGYGRDGKPAFWIAVGAGMPAALAGISRRLLRRPRPRPGRQQR